MIRQVVRSAAIWFALGAVGCSGSRAGRAAGDSQIKSDDQPPEPPCALQCSTVGVDVFLSWSNTDTYDTLSVLRDGTVIATVSGGSDSFSCTVPDAGTYRFGLQAVSGGLASEEISCTVEVEGIPPAEDLSCEYDTGSAAVVLSWENPVSVSVDSVRVTRNGSAFSVLGPDQTTCLDPSPPEGSVRYEITVISGQAQSVPTACVVEVPALAPVASLRSTVDVETGDVLLTWSISEPYDAVVVLLGGEEIAQLPGTAAEFRYENSSVGIFHFGVYAQRGGRTSQVALKEVSLGRLQWEPVEGFDIAGYRVYLWAEGEETPGQDDMVLSVGPVDSLSLSELFWQGLLPSSSQVQVFNIALASLDSEGNVSELSEPASFAWQVFLDPSLQ